MAGLRGDAAIAGIVELPAHKKPTTAAGFSLEEYARLAKAVLDDAGLDASVVDGIVTHGVEETEMFAPATLSEYLGIPVNFAEVVDLGGAASAGMVWRAAAAVELGLCDAVLVVVPGSYNVRPQSKRVAGFDSEYAGSVVNGVVSQTGIGVDYFGASSNRFGSPQAEFEIPYGHLGQNSPYAQIARRYASVFDYDERAMAKIAADQRTNACAFPNAVFHGQPLTIDDVLASPMIADPLHKLEIVMPVQGGAGVLVVNSDLAKRGKRRPVWITGFGEHVSFKTPTYAEDLLYSPVSKAAGQAFAMASLTPGDVDMASIYDCYTITVLMSIEDSGFCEKGKGMEFVASHDLTFRGDFPVNTVGGQLSYGQAGMAGGMHHVVDGARQIMGRAGDAQVKDCNRAYVTGNGGIMSEQVALIFQGD